MYLLTGPIWDIVSAQAHFMSFVKLLTLPALMGYERVSYTPDTEQYVYVYEIAEGASSYVV